MKRTSVLLLLVPILALIPLLGQTSNVKADPSAAGSQVVSAFTGGSVWTSGTTGTCIWYFPILGDLKLADLFAPDASGAPAIDKEHAYFIWVSDWSIQAMAQNSGFGGSIVSIAVVPAGGATIYYSDNPTGRDWSDYSQRSSWGIPIAKFVRGAGLFQSPDGFQLTDRFNFSARIVTAKEIVLNGTPFSFRALMPHGMTCFEYGQAYSTTETGSCVGTSE